MGSSTVLLVLKSLIPFIREILLKDKLLKELFLSNKLASMMTVCVVILFVLFLHTSELMTNAKHANALLTQKVEFQDATNESLRERVKTLTEQCEPRREDNSPTGHHIPEAAAPPKTSVPISKKKPSRTKISGKAQIAERFKTFD